ncbi:MAG: hypothetical protein J6Y26_03210 [Lachnospiraceae bacterium]|nr:hypothetical protein [Lachnospiraceae bacterium]
MDERIITLDEIRKLCGYGTRIRVLNGRTGKVILDGLGELARSKDKRQKAKWDAYKDLEVTHLYPGIVFSKGTIFSDSAYLIIQATISDTDDTAARKWVKKILAGGSGHEGE